MLKGLSKPLQYALIAVLLVVCYVVLQPMLSPQEAAKSMKRPTTTKTKVAKGMEMFTPEDFQAKFQPVGSPVKNSFKPLVAKTPSLGLGAGAPQVGPKNLVPIAFAGGEANWTYTGTIEIDGALQALLENKATGDSIFLSIGEHWKTISVGGITEDTLTLLGPNGETVVLRLASDEDTIQPLQAANAAPVTMSGPALRGAIGGGFGRFGIQPDGTAANNGETNGD